jgi:ATP-dependent helicase HrpB
MPIPLPIDAHLPSLLALLEAHPIALLTAEPGAGKTTRVPPALLQAPWARDKQVWVLQPRRLAALVAAWRVSEEQGFDKPGGLIGYHFRFDRVEARDTRVLFLTEGMFLRRLQANPRLEGVACVILDEFHERSLDADLGLALLRRLRESRADLKLLIMSATIDSGAISAALGGCPVLACPGRSYPIEQRYLERDRSDASEYLDRKAARALREVYGAEGDILVFLPGTGEIRRTAEKLASDPFFGSRRVLQLHGQLSPAEQKRVLGPADKPKVILSTNVAETSLTVPGVRVVVDLGVTRRDAFNPFSGLSALVTQPASQAAMQQRAGRAGREAPGLCLRCCAPAEFNGRQRFDEPELQRADLAGALLQALAAGFGDLGALPWLQAPPPAHVEAARRLLVELGALGDATLESGAGELTPKGRALARAPLHPRLGAVAWEARAGSHEEWDELLRCLGVLSEERMRELDFFTLLKRFEPQGPSKQLMKQVGDWLDSEKERPAATQGPWLERLALSLLRAFPDQVGYCRQGTDRRGEARFALAGGGEASSRSDTMNISPGFYLLVEIVESRALGAAAGLPRAQSLLPIQPDWLLEALPLRCRDEVSVHWDPAAKRVQARERLMYGPLMLDEGEAKSPLAREKMTQALLGEARKAGLGAFCGEGQPGKYLSRRGFALQGAGSGAPALPDEEALWAALAAAAETSRSFSDLAAHDILKQALDAVPGSRRFLDERCPSRLRLPSGKETSIHYDDGKPPWVASRMQDFFGMRETPRVGGQALTVQLLAPNQRPQQVTQDLAGFWEREYPRIRKELMRKYPRHAWPEDPYAPSRG